MPYARLAQDVSLNWGGKTKTNQNKSKQIKNNPTLSILPCICFFVCFSLSASSLLLSVTFVCITTLLAIRLMQLLIISHVTVDVYINHICYQCLFVFFSLPLTKKKKSLFASYLPSSSLSWPPTHLHAHAHTLTRTHPHLNPTPKPHTYTHPTHTHTHLRIHLFY